MNSEQFRVRADEVIHSLEAAFPRLPVPHAYQHEDGRRNYEVDDDVKKFIGRSWADMDLDDWIRSMGPAAIRDCTSATFFRYYLPSLLVGVLGNMEWAHLALSALLPDNQKLEPRAEWLRFRQGFTPSQVAAIAAFLELLKDSCDPAWSDWFGADAGLSGLWK